MSIEERQKPREGSAFATYAHQRQPNKRKPVVFWALCLIAAVSFWGWLYSSAFAIQMEFYDDRTIVNVEECVIAAKNGMVFKEEVLEGDEPITVKVIIAPPHYYRMYLSENITRDKGMVMCTRYRTNYQ
jgi:hypothetical protein